MRWANLLKRPSSLKQSHDEGIASLAPIIGSPLHQAQLRSSRPSEASIFPRALDPCRSPLVDRNRRCSVDCVAASVAAHGGR